MGEGLGLARPDPRLGRPLAGTEGLLGDDHAALGGEGRTELVEGSARVHAVGDEGRDGAFAEGRQRLDPLTHRRGRVHPGDHQTLDPGPDDQGVGGGQLAGPDPVDGGDRHEGSLHPQLVTDGLGELRGGAALARVDDEDARLVLGAEGRTTVRSGRVGVEHGARGAPTLGHRLDDRGRPGQGVAGHPDARALGQGRGPEADLAVEGHRADGVPVVEGRGRVVQDARGGPAARGVAGVLLRDRRRRQRRAQVGVDAVPHGHHHEGDLDLVELRRRDLRGLPAAGLGRVGERRARHPSLAGERGERTAEAHLDALVAGLLQLVRTSQGEALVEPVHAGGLEAEPAGQARDVHRRVAGAQDEDPRPALGRAPHLGEEAVGVAARAQGVLRPLEEGGGVGDALEVRPGHREADRDAGPGGHDDGVVHREQVVDRLGGDRRRAAQVDPGLDELLPRTTGDRVGQREVRHPPHRQSARGRVLLVDGHLDPGLDEVPGCSGTRRTRPDDAHRHRLAVPAAHRGRRHRDLVGDEALEPADGDGHAARQRPGARALALRGLVADARADVGHHARASQDGVGALEVTLGHGLDELGDVVVGRTPPHAGGVGAGEAAARLGDGLVPAGEAATRLADVAAQLDGVVQGRVVTLGHGQRALHLNRVEGAGPLALAAPHAEGVVGQGRPGHGLHREGSGGTPDDALLAAGAAVHEHRDVALGRCGGAGLNRGHVSLLVRGVHQDVQHDGGGAEQGRERHGGHLDAASVAAHRHEVTAGDAPARPHRGERADGHDADLNGDDPAVRADDRGLVEGRGGRADTEEVADRDRDPGHVLEELRQLAGEVVGADDRDDPVHEGEEVGPKGAHPVHERTPPTRRHAVGVGEGPGEDLADAGHHQGDRDDDPEVVDGVRVLGEVRVGVQPAVEVREGGQGVELLVDDQAEEQGDGPGDVGATAGRRDDRGEGLLEEEPDVVAGTGLVALGAEAARGVRVRAAGPRVPRAAVAVGVAAHAVLGRAGEAGLAVASAEPGDRAHRADRADEGRERADVAAEGPALEEQEEEQGRPHDAEHHEARRHRVAGAGDVEELLDPGEEEEGGHREQEAVLGDALGHLEPEADAGALAAPEGVALDPLAEATERAHGAPGAPDDDHHHEDEGEPQVPGDGRREVEARDGGAEDADTDHQPEDDLVGQDQQELEAPVAQDARHSGQPSDVQARGGVGRGEASDRGRVLRCSRANGHRNRIDQVGRRVRVASGRGLGWCRHRCPPSSSCLLRYYRRTTGVPEYYH